MNKNARARSQVSNNIVGGGVFFGVYFFISFLLPPKPQVFKIHKTDSETHVHTYIIHKTEYSTL